MSDVYRIFGSEISPYSIKVRSYFRYKGIPHEWIERSNAVMDEFKKYAKTDKFWNSPHPNTCKWMRLKTVIRQLFKEVPIPSVSRQQMDREEAVEAGDVTVENYLELVSGEDGAPYVHGADVKKTEAVAKKAEPKKAKPAKPLTVPVSSTYGAEPEPELEAEMPLHGEGEYNAQQVQAQGAGEDAGDDDKLFSDQ